MSCVVVCGDLWKGGRLLVSTRKLKGRGSPGTDLVLAALESREEVESLGPAPRKDMTAMKLGTLSQLRSAKVFVVICPTLAHFLHLFIFLPLY